MLCLLTATVGRRPLLALCVCDLLFRRILSRLRRNQTSAVKPTINASVRLSGSSQHRHQHQHHLFLSFPSVVCAGDDAVWLSLRLVSLPLPPRSFPLLALSFILECHSFDPNPCPKRQQNRQTDRSDTDTDRSYTDLHHYPALAVPPLLLLLNSLPYPTQTHPLLPTTTCCTHCTALRCFVCLPACLPACLRLCCLVACCGRLPAFSTHTPSPVPARGALLSTSAAAPKLLHPPSRGTTSCLPASLPALLQAQSERALVYQTGPQCAGQTAVSVAE